MSDKQEIIDLENRFWKTMIDKDVETATAMMADKSIVTGAQGAATIDNQAFGKMMREGKWTLESYTFSDVQVEFPAPDVAVIGYKVSERLILDGEPLTMDAADASTWIKRDGQWQCALHTESVLGDPFGRDRAPTKRH
ncbi:MAG: nuclear transport factor 2 family protein [Sphingobium sp.]|nr:nuclear transport factor 2 family protein [Sphingobium sp.]